MKCESAPGVLEFLCAFLALFVLGKHKKQQEAEAASRGGGAASGEATSSPKKKRLARVQLARVRLGVASALFGPSSVTTDFGQTMARLPRDVFEVPSSILL